eukprot:361208-Chlamydomonas_euryale.AAC.4
MAAAATAGAGRFTWQGLYPACAPLAMTASSRWTSQTFRSGRCAATRLRPPTPDPESGMESRRGTLRRADSRPGRTEHVSEG